ncbi:MAG: radical SAM protein [Nitrospirota bacterium]
MANVKIIIPRSEFLDSDRVMPAIGPLYLKSFLENKGHNVTIDDTPNEDSLGELDNYDVIGLSTTTPQYEIGGRHLARQIKEIALHTKLIIGGTHAKFYTSDILEENLFDHIVRGDGEIAFLDILEGKNLPVVVSYPNLTEEEINSFPLPWRDKQYLSKYHYTIGDRNATTAITGKNCPMGCKYCESRRSGLTLFSVDRIDAEINSIKEAGFDSIMFFDDIFAINEKRTHELCDIIKPHNITFRCFGHAKLLHQNTKVLSMLAESGCKEVGFGAESGDQGILDTVGKGNKVEEVERTIANILIAGMRVSAFFMIGLPGESEQTICETERLIAKFAANSSFRFDYAIYYPYKGTYIRDHLQEFDIQFHLEGSIGYYKGSKGLSECCVSTSHLTQDQIISHRNRIIQRYQENFKGKESSQQSSKST